MNHLREFNVVIETEEQLRGVYAVLASRAALAAALAAVNGGSGNIVAPVAERAKPATEKPSEAGASGAESAPAGDGTIATSGASPSDVKVDAAGTPFDPDRHTGSIVKSGLWRMKAGLSRGPGEGEDAIPKADGTGTTSDGPASDAGEAATAATVEVEEDEFAAFTKANAEAEGAAAAAVPERTWADADLSSLCAQAATKLGNADPIREIIANYTPEGETPHSRNVPAENRAAFAAEIEKAAGITYAG